MDGVNPYKLCLRRDIGMMASVTPNLKQIYGKNKVAPMTRMWIYTQLKDQLKKAGDYKEEPDKPKDAKLAALKRVIDGELPLFVSADSALAAQHVWEIVRAYPALKLILVNGFGLTGHESWIIENKIPVIFRTAAAVLDKAADVEEALALFRQYDMHASVGVDYHFLLADAAGNCALVEYIHNELSVLYPEKHTEDGLPYLAVTNDYIDPRGPAVKKPGGYRLRRLNETLTETGARMSERDCKDLLRRVRLEYRHKLGHRVITLWSAVYNCSQRTVSLIAGDNDRDVYRFTAEKEEWTTD